MKLGKIGRFNQKVNRKIKEVCLENDIPFEYCEYYTKIGAPTDGTSPHGFVATAHRHKRDWYKENKMAKLPLLYHPKQFLRLCQWHHDLIEYNKELNDKVFEVLRGELTE